VTEAMAKANILVDIAKENADAYCISPETVHEAINRGVSKADICTAIVDCMAENTGTFYMEDSGCCAFVAMHEEYYDEAVLLNEESDIENS
jgi:hypothetical protein